MRRFFCPPTTLSTRYLADTTNLANVLADPNHPDYEPLVEGFIASPCCEPEYHQVRDKALDDIAYQAAGLKPRIDHNLNVRIRENIFTAYVYFIFSLIIFILTVLVMVIGLINEVILDSKTLDFSSLKDYLSSDIFPFLLLFFLSVFPAIISVKFLIAARNLNEFMSEIVIEEKYADESTPLIPNEDTISSINTKLILRPR